MSQSQKKELLAAMEEAVKQGDQAAAQQLAEKALQTSLPPLEAIEQGFVPGLRQAGQLWEEGEFFLPELVTAAQAMKAAMSVLQPELAKTVQTAPAGRVLVGTVSGDIHDIGKTLVGTLLAANGFSVVDEGAEVPVERFVHRARELDVDLICASALLTTTMGAQRDLVLAVRDAGLRAKVMVGGAPVTAQWAEEIGAHGYADNAVAAVAEARKLV